MLRDAEFSADQVWLWDLYPLADDAWPSVSLSRVTWSDWIVEPGETTTLRRWVTGPNGPSFLTEYTPADDYITEGSRGRHETFNGLYRDADREFYIPRTDDLSVLRRFDSHVRPETPDWTAIRVALCQAGYKDIDLAMTKAPVLIGFLSQLTQLSGSNKSDLVSPGSEDGDTESVLQAEQTIDPNGQQTKEHGLQKTHGTPCMENSEEEQFGGPQDDPFNPRVVRWVGKRLYLGPEGSQVRELFTLLAKKPGVPHSLFEVQLAVEGMTTMRDTHGEDAFRKSMNRIAKALSKLRKHLQENDLDDHVVILKEGPRDEPSYTLISRFGNS